MITIVNYGMGNIGSIVNMLKRVGVKAISTSAVSDIEKAEKIILPGVGAFDAAMGTLAELELIDVLNYKILEQKTPVLGICLGMQLMTKTSEEGRLPGFGWVDADTIKFDPNTCIGLKVPHMGWNTVVKNGNSLLTDDFESDTRFYFVHSYYVKCSSTKNSMFKTIHGVEFDSGIQNDNIYGVQFHPEKSHRFGKKILSKFASI